MITLETVKTELKNNNFPLTGSYETLPEITYQLVKNIIQFGNDEVKKSTLGKGIKEIALRLANTQNKNIA